MAKCPPLNHALTSNTDICTCSSAGDFRRLASFMGRLIVYTHGLVGRAVHADLRSGPEGHYLHCGPLTMDVPCPNCDHPLQVASNVPLSDTSNLLETISGINCPNCGFVALQSLPEVFAELDQHHDRTLSFGVQGDYVEATPISHFRLVRLLGNGGFGTVWLADDVNLERQVALKLPNSRNKDLANLLHEAQAAAHLRHPNIVSIYEVGTENGQVFIACEFIDGMTLRDLLTTGTPSVSRTVEMTISIAEALQHAHSNEIIHRDVKPANILLNAVGVPYVTDFGLAKRVSNQSTETTISSEGQILGTARYMSPEQASGKTRQTDHRSDIYAVGVMLFEMLTGHVPFRGNMRAVLQQKIFDDPPSPRALDQSIPRDLETICLKCLERDPQKRYNSAGEVAQELRRFVDGEPILARPITRLERTWRWCRKRPMISGLLVSLLTTLSVGLAGVSFFGLRAAHSANLLRQSLYRAQMSLASDYLVHGDIHSVRQTLEAAHDQQVTPDLRGFEWYYFHAQTAPFLQIVNHSDHVDGVAIAADGNLVAAVGRDHNVRIWNARDGSQIATLPDEASRVEVLAFSPMTSQLATGSGDGWVRFWNPSEPQRPVSQFKHGPPVVFLSYSPNGRKLLTAGSTGAARLWDANTDELLDEIPTGLSGTKAVQFLPDGESLLIATADGRVRIRDTETRQVRTMLEPNPDVETIAVSDDGKIIAVASYTGRLRIWSVDDATLLSTESTSYGLIGGMVFLKDSPVLAVVGTSRQLVLYDTQQRRVVRELYTHFLTDGVLDRTPDGRRLVIGSGEGSVKILDAADLTRPNNCWHQGPLRGLTFTGDEQAVAISGDGAIRRWDLNTGEFAALRDVEQTVTRCAGSSTAGLVAIATAEPAVQLCAVEDGRLLRSLPVQGRGVVDLAFSPDGRWLAIAERNGSVQLVRTGEETLEPRQLPATESSVQALVFVDDNLLVLAGVDGRLTFVDPTTGVADLQTVSIDGTPHALEYCPATARLAVGTDTGLLHLVNVPRRQLMTSLRAHTSRINVLHVLPNGRTLVTGGRDRTMRTWDTASGDMLTPLYGHARQVFCIAAAPNGELLCSGDLEGCLRIWRGPRNP